MSFHSSQVVTGYTSRVSVLVVIDNGGVEPFDANKGSSVTAEGPGPSSARSSTSATAGRLAVVPSHASSAAQASASQAHTASSAHPAELISDNSPSLTAVAASSMLEANRATLSIDALQTRVEALEKTIKNLKKSIRKIEQEDVPGTTGEIMTLRKECSKNKKEIAVIKNNIFSSKLLESYYLNEALKQVGITPS
jgi:septal ring factor EnvC (AmiA/AmiB activator)